MEKFVLAVAAAIFVGLVVANLGRRFNPKVGKILGMTCGIAVFALWLSMIWAPS